MHTLHYNYNNVSIYMNSLDGLARPETFRSLCVLKQYRNYNEVHDFCQIILLYRVSPLSENYLKKLIANQHHINVILLIFHVMDT